MGKGTDGGTLDAETTAGVQNLQGKGSPLPDRTRVDMEQSFGADFSNVRVHTGAEAETLSRSMNARAFTHGSNIAFNKGEYSPDSQSGKRLLAHELTHTVQQGKSVSSAISREPLPQTKEKEKVDLLPQPLPEKVGTLDYYRARHNDFVRRYGNTRTPPDYYLTYGDKYAHKFNIEAKPRMSERGKAWVDKTFRLLQKKIEDKLMDNREEFGIMEVKGDALRDFAFDTHPDAYVEGGLANLYPEDVAVIIETIQDDLLTLESLKQALITSGMVTPLLLDRLRREYPVAFYILIRILLLPFPVF